MTDTHLRPAGSMRAVLFDVGGTLIHVDHPRIAAIIEEVLGRRVALGDLLAGEYQGREAMERFVAEHPEATDGQRWDVNFRGLLAAVGVSDAELPRVGAAIRASHQTKHLWCAVPAGTAEALDALARAGWYVGCVSNADGRVTELLEAHALRHRLRCVIDSGTVGIEKPDPRIFAFALAQSGIPAHETYYVGDMYANDVVGARAAGLVPVLLDPLGRYGDRGCRTTPDVPAFCRELVSLRDAA